MGISTVQKLRKKNKMKESATCNRFLISINVFGSAGPIRLVVKGDDNATAVIEAALKIYGREGRLPTLGSNAGGFFLYPAHAEFQAMSPSEKIGSGGERKFVLGKKEKKPHMTEGRREMTNGKGRGWKAWLHNSLKASTLSLIRFNF